VSEASDAIAAAFAPKKKPTMTLEQAQALAAKKNPLLSLPRGDVGLGLQAQTNQAATGGKPLNRYQLGMGVAGMNARGDRAAGGMARTTARDAAPAADVMQKASNLFEAPFTLGGALAADLSEGRGTTPLDNTATGHALKLMGQRKFGEARNQYSFTSWNMVRRLAKDGNPAAQFALAHPTIGSFAMGATEFVNPSNAIGGKLFELGGDAAKTIATGAGRGASGAWRRFSADPAAVAGKPLYKAAQSLGEVATGARMASVRQAAYDEAIRSGATRKQANVYADRADLTGRKMVNATETAKADAQPMVREVFGGLSPQQKLEVLDAIEATPSKLPQSLLDRFANLQKGGSPTANTMKGLPDLNATSTVPDLQRRVSAYRTWRGQMDARTIHNGLAEPGEMWSGPTYFPRRGMTKDPNVEESEEQTAQDEEIAARRSRGGQNVRRDTLNKNVPSRKFGSRAEVLRAGFKMDPDWDPAETLYNHAISRGRSNILEEGAHELTGLGLAEPLESVDKLTNYGFGKSPREFEVGDTRKAHRKDYLPFTELGSVRQFGSPLFRGSAVHPAVADLIEDLAASQKTNQGLPTLAEIPQSVLGSVNKGLSKLEVSQPLYHVPVNVIPNMLMSFATHGVDVPGLVKALVHPKAAMAEAQRGGADFPYADPNFKASDMEPAKGQSLGRKVGQAALRDPARIVDAISSTPLYKHMQPYVAAAAYGGLKKRIGPEAAALDVRSMVGEPENLGAREKGLGEATIFPSWQKSQLRRAVRMLGANPALYQAAHTDVNDRNASKGVSPDPTSWSSLIPDIVTHVHKNGAIDKTPIPGPFNRAIGLADAIGNLATGGGNQDTVARDLVNTLNPVLGLGARYLQTRAGPAGDVSSSRLYDKDSSDAQQRRDLLMSIVNRYNPDRGAKDVKSGLLGLLGIEPQTEMSPDASKRSYVWEQRVRGAYPTPFRKEIENFPNNAPVEFLRQLAKQAEKKGPATINGRRWTAAQLTAAADRTYAEMEDRVKKFAIKQTTGP
jgi:hypothetical protein